MEILKKIILTNNNQSILFPCDSRNDNSLSKLQQNCKNNNSNNSIIKSNYINLKNDEKILKIIKIPLSAKKIKFSLENKNNKKEKEIKNECQE